MNYDEQQERKTRIWNGKTKCTADETESQKEPHTTVATCSAAYDTSGKDLDAKEKLKNMQMQESLKKVKDTSTYSLPRG
jgi:hypothetical protein